MMKRILLAGATGRVGKEIVKTLSNHQDIAITALARDEERLHLLQHQVASVRSADTTREEQLRGICEDTDIVISCLGLSRPKHRDQYRRLHYQGNLNLLREAECSKVKKFVFISMMGTDSEPEICDFVLAKRDFEEELKKSSIEWVIIRPSGFMNEVGHQFLNITNKGRVLLIGNKRSVCRFSPIHVADVASAVIAHLDKSHEIIDIEGPDSFTYVEIFTHCFHLLKKPAKFIYIPIWLFDLLCFLAQPFLGTRYVMLRFVRWAMTRDLVGKPWGSHHLLPYLEERAKAFQPKKPS